MEQQNQMTRSEVMDLAMSIGQMFLKSGSETSRVEEAITRFCANHGYKDINVFATPTIIIIGDESTSNSNIVSRIRSRNTNSGMIIKAADLSYNFDRWNLDYSQGKAWIKKAMTEKQPYNDVVVALAAGLGSAVFSVMLGGNLHDFGGAFLIGSLARFTTKELNRYLEGVFWEVGLAGFLICLLSLVYCDIDHLATMERTIVGAIMPYLPGVAFTTGIRDYIAGELIAGNARIAEAILLAASIAVGIVFALRVWVWMGWPV